MLGSPVYDMEATSREPVALILDPDFRIEFDEPAPHAEHAWYPPIKTVAEWMGAVLLLLISAPLISLLALLVKATSSGPAFYAQTRLGQFGRRYRIYKLRTMCHNAEAHSGPVWAAQDDVRITPIGKFLRDTHLDELPQLWNVVKGEMSLIGPRPERPEIAARIATRVPNFHHRLRMKPGVTGLAQMLLPADDPNDVHCEGVRRKLAHDLFYLRRTNPLMDAKIAVCTTCYFVSAAIDAVRRRILRSCAAMIEQPTAAVTEAAELTQGVA